MLASITNNNSPPPLLKVEQQQQQRDTFLLDDEIDDDESYQRKEIGSIDTAHQFLNFSRKVTEASSMKRPVDIQLGIACGKDLVFGSSRLIKPTSSLSMKPSFTTTHLDHNKKKLEPATVKKVVAPTTTTEKKLSSLASPTTKIANDNKEMTHRSLPLLHNHHNESNSNNSSNKSSTSSPLLDRLVADVLSHIDSCPDRAAYSVDLDRLKPKLQAYSVTRLPPSLTTSS